MLDAIHNTIPFHGLDRSLIQLTSRYSSVAHSPLPNSPKVVLNQSQLRSILSATTRDKCLAFGITAKHAEHIVDWVTKVYRKEVLRNPIDHTAALNCVYLYRVEAQLPDIGYLVGRGRSTYATFGMCDSYEVRALIELHENRNLHDYDIQAQIDPDDRDQEYSYGASTGKQRMQDRDAIPVKAQFYWYEPEDDALSDILDFMIHNEAHLPPEVSRMSYSDAVAATEMWHKHLEAQKQKEFAKMNKGIRVFLEPAEPVEYDLHILADEAALIYEGVKQHHCVASYWIPVATKRTIILNFRNKETGVEFTGELARPYRMATDSTATVTMSQLRGACNAAPSDEAKQAMVLSLNACMPALAKYVNETAIETFEVKDA